MNHYSLLLLHYMHFLFLIMWQFRYPVLLWPNKSGATPIIKHLCQENCVNQMLRAGYSCSKRNNMAVRKKKIKILLWYRNPAGCLHAHHCSLATSCFTGSHVQLCGISKHYQPNICRHNDLLSCRLDCCWLFCWIALLNVRYIWYWATGWNSQDVKHTNRYASSHKLTCCYLIMFMRNLHNLTNINLYSEVPTLLTRKFKDMKINPSICRQTRIFLFVCVCVHQEKISETKKSAVIIQFSYFYFTNQWDCIPSFLFSIGSED